MLTENKFSKYFIYAIGEIILVVIGILIAIQLNKWNESLKERDLFFQYRERLIEEIESDLIAVEMRIKYFEDAKFFAEEGLNFINNHKENPEVLYENQEILNKAIIAFMMASNIWTFRPARPTYEELTSTGNIHLLGDMKARGIIVNYYRALEQKATYWETPQEYRVRVRSLIHNNLQKSILAACETFKGSSISITGKMNRDCNIELEENLVKQSIIQILKDDNMPKSLTYLISYYRTALSLYKEQEESSKYALENLK